MAINVRTADPEKDAKAILDIYAPYIENTAITYEYVVPSLKEFRERITNTLKKYPYIVLEEDGQIKGYAYVSPFKARKAYQWGVETSIYVAMNEKGNGYGRILYDTLEEILKKQKIVMMYACIACPSVPDEYLNNDSMHFHEHLGYSLVGRFNKCANKFSRWYDMIWMEKTIGERMPEQEDIIPFPELKY